MITSFSLLTKMITDYMLIISRYLTMITSYSFDKDVDNLKISNYDY